MSSINAVRTPKRASTTNAVFFRGLTVDEIRHAAALRCAYPSKVCANARALKISGELHRLCEFHRRKANMNQQRMQQRRRMVRAEQEARSFQSAQQFPTPLSPALESKDYHDARFEQSLDSESESRTECDLVSKPAPAFCAPLDASKRSCSLSLLFADVSQTTTEVPVQDANTTVVTSQDVELLQSILFGEPIIAAFDGVGACSIDDILANSSGSIGMDEAKLRFVEMLDFSL